MPRLRPLVGLLLSCFCVLPLAAQPLHVRVYTGWEAYGHRDLENLQEELRLVIREEAFLQQDDRVPGVLGLHVELVLGYGNFRAGVVAGYSATRGRLQYGEGDSFVRFDQDLDRLWGGMTFESRFLFRLPVWAMLQIRFSDTAVALRGLVSDGTSQSRSLDKLEATGLSLAPGLIYEWQREALEVRLVVGFEYSLEMDELKDPVTNTLFLEDQRTHLRATWSGLRFGLSVGGIANRLGK